MTAGMDANSNADGGQPIAQDGEATTLAAQDATSQPASDDTTTETAKTAETTQAPDPLAGFETLGLGPDAIRAIRDLGFGEPTPIQQQTIGELLAGRDVIGQAPTGTGKTAAFGLPIVERLDVNQLAPQALIVVPTRELCIQVSEAMHNLGKFRELVSLPIYGGQPYERQFRALARGVQVVVGTPGRLLDHLNRKTLDLSTVKMVVLDEADEMLDMGFLDDIESILSALPGQHQSALFSATIPPRIARLSEQYLHNPVRVSVAAREAVAPRVRQVYYEVPYPAKSEVLSRILDLETPDSAIVFVNTRRDADMVSEQLNGLGYLAQAIHGEITQAQRERSLDRFRSGRTQVLVATDVAARGLDIPDVSHIINYDLPLDAESYVHRIGRTGRAGRTGEAITLVTPRERRQLRLIEQGIHRNLERLRLPTPADVAARRRMAFREEVLSILDGGQLDPYLALVEDLVGSREPADLAAAAFKMAAQAMQTRRPGQPMNWMEMPPPVEQPEPFAQPERPGRRDRGERDERPRDGRDGGRDTRDQRARARSFLRDTERGAPGMARLFIRVGRQDSVRPTDIVGAIANEAHIPGDSIGDIDIYDGFSFVEVPEEAAERVRTALNATTIRGRAPRATLAKPAGEWMEDVDLRDERRPTRPSRPAEDERRPLRAPFGGRRAGPGAGFRGGRPGEGGRGRGSDRPAPRKRR
ncbi:MAG TPA: DEAD/DEAH box helicase [Ktedonobacterales bacterium]|nr:DEAD/DEAH box helicase [Ktedonobacterales bacterium]